MSNHQLVFVSMKCIPIWVCNNAMHENISCERKISTFWLVFRFTIWVRSSFYYIWIFLSFTFTFSFPFKNKMFTTKSIHSTEAVDWQASSNTSFGKLAMFGSWMNVHNISVFYHLISVFICKSKIETKS